MTISLRTMARATLLVAVPFLATACGDRMVSPTSALTAGSASRNVAGSPGNSAKNGAIDVRLLLDNAGTATLQVRTGSYNAATGAAVPDGFFQSLQYKISDASGKQVAVRNVNFRKAEPQIFESTIDLCSRSATDDGDNAASAAACPQHVGAGWTVSVQANLEDVGGDPKKTDVVREDAGAANLPDLRLGVLTVSRGDGTFGPVTGPIASNTPSLFTVGITNGAAGSPPTAATIGAQVACDVSVTDLAGHVVYTTSSTVFVAPGATTPCQFSLNLPSGSYQLLVVARPLSSSDFDLSNNTLVQTLTVAAIDVRSFTLSVPALAVATGASGTVTLRAFNGAGVPITSGVSPVWTSSNGNVSVSGGVSAPYTATITGITPGTATITVTLGALPPQSVAVTVAPPSPAALTLGGASFQRVQLSAATLYGGPLPTGAIVSFVSLDPTIAQVTSAGLLTPRGNGTTSILFSVTVPDAPSSSTSVLVPVTILPPNNCAITGTLALTPHPMTVLVVGEDARSIGVGNAAPSGQIAWSLGTQVSDAGGSLPVVELTTDGLNATVRPIAAGTATLNAREIDQGVSGPTGTGCVVVLDFRPPPPPPPPFTVNPAPASCTVGGQVTLTADVASNVTVTWTLPTNSVSFAGTSANTIIGNSVTLLCNGPARAAGTPATVNVTANANGLNTAQTVTVTMFPHP